jgi:hypothetical protein
MCNYDNAEEMEVMIEKAKAKVGHAFVCKDLKSESLEMALWRYHTERAATLCARIAGGKDPYGSLDKTARSIVDGAEGNILDTFCRKDISCNDHSLILLWRYHTCRAEECAKGYTELIAALDGK